MFVLTRDSVGLKAVDLTHNKKSLIRCFFQFCDQNFIQALLILTASANGEQLNHILVTNKSIA